MAYFIKVYLFYSACTHQGYSINLRIGIAGISPYVYIENGKFHGSDVQMIEILSEIIGFSYTLTQENTPYNGDEMLKASCFTAALIQLLLLFC